MIFAATIVYFDPANCKLVEHAVTSFKNTEIHYKDEKAGKLVIIIEAENADEIENVRLELSEKPFVEDVYHYAFHFGEEVEKYTQEGIIPDFDIENAFKKHRKL